MKRILFITNRNILTTSGELRLIKNRAESLYVNYGIPTDFIALSSRERINAESKEIIEAGGVLQTFELDITNPVITASSYRKVKKVIYEKLETGLYGAVIFSGTTMAFYAKGIKKRFDVRIYLDIHGALEDILEVSKNASRIKGTIFRALYHVDIKAVKQATNYSEGYFVVTEALEEYIKERFPVAKEKQFFIIPCATSTTPIDETEYKRDRANYRNKYCIKEDEIVFVYSGGVSSWQCVEESIELYKSLAEKLNKNARMLVFSHNISEIKKRVNGDTRIQTDSYSPNELFHALRAGDFAFLLRRDNLTNNVAFPNKFLEYVQSGMRIITTPYVKEIAKQVERYNLGFIYDFDDNVDELLCYVRNVDQNTEREKTIDAVLEQNSFSYTTKKFAEGFLDGNKK